MPHGRGLSLLPSTMELAELMPRVSWPSRGLEAQEHPWRRESAGAGDGGREQRPLLCWAAG